MDSFLKTLLRINQPLLLKQQRLLTWHLLVETARLLVPEPCKAVNTDFWPSRMGIKGYVGGMNVAVAMAVTAVAIAVIDDVVATIVVAAAVTADDTAVDIVAKATKICGR